MWAAIKARLRRAPGSDAPETGTAPDPSTSGPRPSTASPPQKDRPFTTDPGRSHDELFTEGFLGRKIREATVDEVFDDLEIVLLQSDVALPVVDRMRKNLRRDLAGRKLRLGVDAEEAIRTSLSRSVRSILDRPSVDLAALVRAQAEKPYVILFVGVNGTGKTTTLAKLAGWLRAQGLTSVIAAGDTFRAGAIEQLLVHGERLGVRVIRQKEGSDPAAVAFDAVDHARAKKVDVVLVDTAGRQHTNDNLIEEAKKIRRVVKPSLTIFVGDALSGHDVVEQAREFDAAIGFDGLILTKLDADVKGGSALSLTFITKKPILFVGTGQGYDDLRPFDPEWMVERLFAEGTSG
ncbi:MAG: signal recognition particle-docking protein FtsY [Thermoplasmata archaeon]|nr:signal recognition particle-docking protein FtsY [Thermoplasmata archaeon]